MIYVVMEIVIVVFDVSGIYGNHCFRLCKETQLVVHGRSSTRRYGLFGMLV